MASHGFTDREKAQLVPYLAKMFVYKAIQSIYHTN